MLPDLEQQKEVWNQLFHRWFKGNPYAVEYGFIILEAAHLIDDLTDNVDFIKHRRLIDEGHVDRVFIALMTRMLTNPFVQMNAQTLAAEHMRVWLDWKTANHIEKHDRDETLLAKALVLRASIYSVFGHVAAILGGQEWGAEVSREAWVEIYGETMNSLHDELEVEGE